MASCSMTFREYRFQCHTDLGSNILKTRHMFVMLVSLVNQINHQTTVTRALPIKVQQQPKILIKATINYKTNYVINHYTT